MEEFSIVVRDNKLVVNDLVYGSLKALKDKKPSQYNAVLGQMQEVQSALAYLPARRQVWEQATGGLAHARNRLYELSRQKQTKDVMDSIARVEAKKQEFERLVKFLSPEFAGK